MKKMNKKGFTIVELVIVIAVIAILSAVMIPTFSGIVDKAQKSALEQKIAAAYKEAMATDLADDGAYNLTQPTTSGVYTFTFKAADGDANVTWTTAECGYTSAKIVDGVITLGETIS